MANYIISAAPDFDRLTHRIPLQPPDDDPKRSHASPIKSVRRDGFRIFKRRDLINVAFHIPLPFRGTTLHYALIDWANWGDYSRDEYPGGRVEIYFGFGPFHITYESDAE